VALQPRVSTGLISYSCMYNTSIDVKRFLLLLRKREGGWVVIGCDSMVGKLCRVEDGSRKGEKPTRLEI
jgi:hypothetical protein